MTPQEQQLLTELFQRLAQTRGAPKDEQAQALVHEGLAAVPDAAYWLAQRTLLLENALQQAQQQITQLQREVEQAKQPAASAGSFLSGGLGTHFGRGPEPAYPGAAPVQASPLSPPAQPASGWRDRFMGAGSPRAGMAPAASAAPSAGGSFLGAAAASAAGVAGGMLLFNGLGHWLGGNHDAQATSQAASQTSPQSPSNGLMDPTSSGSTASQAPSGEQGSMDQMAHDAGLDSIDQASSGSWDDGGDAMDDDFA